MKIGNRRGVLPTMASRNALMGLYSELSAEPMPYRKSVVRVHMETGSYEDTVVHTEDHVKLKPKGHRGAKKVETIREFVEMTCGSLYAPAGQGNTGLRTLGTEWSLNFKCDIDLALRRGGNALRTTLEAYLCPSA